MKALSIAAAVLLLGILLFFPHTIGPTEVDDDQHQTALRNLQT